MENAESKAAGVADNVSNLDTNDLALLAAAKQGDLGKVVDALIAGANINVQDDNGNTALLIATDRGDESLATSLIEFGANVQLHNSLGNHAGLVAAGKGCLSILKLLIRQDIDLNRQNDNQDTCLILAADRGDDRTVRLLLSRVGHIEPPLNLDAQNKFGNTAMMVAAGKGYIHIVQSLEKKGAAVDRQNIDQNTVLTLAQKTGDGDFFVWVNTMVARKAKAARRTSSATGSSVETPDVNKVGGETVGQMLGWSSTITFSGSVASVNTAVKGAQTTTPVAEPSESSYATTHPIRQTH